MTRVVQNAASALQDEPEANVASKIATELDERLDLVESRVAELPEFLGAKQAEGWSM